MVGRQEIAGHLTRVLDSEVFRTSPSLAKLLAFCVKTTLAGEEDSLKETTIGILCYGRAASYDTKSDPIVRVNARRLRRELDFFYATEGQHDEVRIKLLPGSYVPRFDRYKEEIALPEVAVSLASPVALANGYGWRIPALLFLVIAMSLVGFVVSRQTRSREAEAPLLTAPVAGKTMTMLREITPGRYQLVQVDRTTGMEDPLGSIDLDGDRDRRAPDQAKPQTKVTPLSRKMNPSPTLPTAAGALEDVSDNAVNAFEPRL